MFKNRLDAAKQIADKIPKIDDVVVLAVPRGGVILGDVIAQKLECPLDIIVSKKITPPNYSEYAIGAITHDGTLYKGEYWSKFSNDPLFENEIAQKQEEVHRRLKAYRKNTSYNLYDKNIILVDDGIATGSTIFAILYWIRKQKPKKILLAVPVIPPNTLDKLKDYVDEVIALIVPDDFTTVGQFYNDFSQVTDSKICEILNKYHG